MKGKMFFLDTERLLLRPLGQGDFDAVHSYAAVPENVRYMTFGPNTPEDTRSFLSDCGRGWDMKPLRKYDLALTLRPGGELVGAVGLYLDPGLREGMFGWILHRGHWGRGYMTEAASCLMRYGFEELRLHRIYAKCFAENHASYRVMERLGMRREGHFVKNMFLRNTDPETWCDGYEYAILSSEWKEAGNAR